MNETPIASRESVPTGQMEIKGRVNQQASQVAGILAALSGIQVELLRTLGLSVEATALTDARLKALKLFAELHAATSVPSPTEALTASGVLAKPEEKEDLELKEPLSASDTKRPTELKCFLDTEFIEAGRHSPVQLISIGIVTESDREYYAESQEFDPKTLSPWLKENVLPHLGPIENRKPVALIAREVREFIGDAKPEFWGYYADYDWVVFCQMFGSMIDLPEGWPMYCRDIKQLCDSIGNPKLPGNDGEEHNALSDAKWNKLALQFLLSEKVARSDAASSAPASPDSPSSPSPLVSVEEWTEETVREIIRNGPWKDPAYWACNIVQAHRASLASLTSRLEEAERLAASRFETIGIYEKRWMDSEQREASLRASLAVAEAIIKEQT